MSGVEERPFDAERELTEGLFLGSEQGTTAYRIAMEQAQQAVIDAFAGTATPYSGQTHDKLATWFEEMECLPEEGKGLTETIETVAETVLRHSVTVSDPACVAHLQCPPMIPALAAEAMIAASNQSMDSWDQSPAATELETNLIDSLAELFGYGERADGVFTSGGTQSNFMGLLLARNWYLDEHFDHNARIDGLPPESDSLRVLCSDAAHFTARQATAQLGLGEDAVVSIATDDDFRLSLDALDSTLRRLHEQDLRPFALVGTAGTTDFGTIDPLSSLAARADKHGLWFHVDAAYGGALALSERHREKLNGIETADSIAVDFHKLCYQPISCGTFLLQDGTHYRFIDRNAAYLDPADDGGVPNLVSKSVQTTRRFDALKPFIAFRSIGREGMEELIDSTLSLADAVADRIDGIPCFELKNEPTLNAIVFRYRPASSSTHTADDPALTDEVNKRIRKRLLSEGNAVVARTTVDDETFLKFTLLNPRTTGDAVERILETIEHYGDTITDEITERDEDMNGKTNGGKQSLRGTNR